MRPTVMEVSLENFKYNINSIKNILNENTEIMPVIKANAYGTYINTRLDIINEFNIVAVAIADEGEFLRKIGYTKEIFILNQPSIYELDKIVNNDLTIGVCEESFIRKLGSINNKIKIHLEIETGMGRTGINIEKISEFVELIKKYKNIKVEGIYTHLSSADCDKKYTEEQINKFDKSIEILEEKLGELRYKHISASNGIINFPSTKYNLVRPGIIMYGYESGDGILDKINLKPVCKLKSKIIFVKEIEKGVSIGYSRKFISEKNMKIATIPIGYADGLRRELFNCGEVVVDDKKVPIIGNICMDSCMVDVTNIKNVKVGDDVWIWENDKIRLEDIGQKCSTINYEIMCTISKRVPRFFR